MKVIGVSNFDIETVSDILICENLSMEEAAAKAEELNAKEGPNSTYYYKSVPDDLKLYKYEP